MDLYSTHALMTTVRSLKRPKTFFLDNWFKTIQTEESAEVHFDVQIGNRKVAPFVGPESKAKTIERDGYRTDTFKPAYVKPLTMLKPRDTLKRAMGEQIGGIQLTLQQRRALIVAETLMDHTDRITRVQEIMAASALVNGTITVEGEGFETQVVNFNRNAALKVVLTGTDRWGQSGAKPLDDIEEWVEKVHEVEGADIDSIVMDPFAWRAFRADGDVRDALDNRRAAGIGPIELGTISLSKGAKYVGSIGSINYYVYSEYWTDDEGVTHPLLPAGTVVGVSSDLGGVRAFGAIMDEDSLQAVEFFPTSWVEKNPSGRMIMTQSAPLVVPTRPNGTFSASVL